MLRGVDHRHILPREGEEARSLALQRQPPRRRRLVGIGRMEVDDVRHRAQRHQLLDGLVRRAIFAHADRVVRKDEQRRRLHDGRNAQRRLGVVREHEERRPERPHAAVHRHAVHCRAHAQLAHAEKHVTPGRIVGKVRAPLEDRLGRSCQIRGPAKQLRHCVEDRVHHLLAGVARRDRLLDAEAGNRLLPSRLQRARLGALEFAGKLGKRGFVAGKELVPPGLLRRAALDRLAPVGQRIFGNQKALVLREPEELFRRRRIRCTHGFAVHFVCSRKRAAVADHRAYRNQRRLVLDSPCRRNRRLNTVQIVSVRYAMHVPSVSVEALVYILGEAPVGRTVERDQIVVVKHNQLAQLQRSRQRGRLVRNAFHHVAIAAQHVRVMIDHVEARPVVGRRQMLLRDGHTHRHCEALPKRPGGRFHAIGHAVLRMPRRLRSPGAKALQIVEGHFVARQK